jgi:hypothetical protein
MHDLRFFHIPTLNGVILQGKTYGKFNYDTDGYRKESITVLNIKLHYSKMIS